MFSFPAFLAPSPADWLALPFQHREVLTEKLEVSFLCCDQSFSLGWTTPAFHGRTQKNLVCCQASSVFKGQKKSTGSLVSNAIAMRTKVKMSIGISLDHTLIITKILRKKKNGYSIDVQIFASKFSDLNFVPFPLLTKPQSQCCTWEKGQPFKNINFTSLVCTERCPLHPLPRRLVNFQQQEFSSSKHVACAQGCLSHTV